MFTVGMATFDDFYGVNMTVQALKMNHAHLVKEIIVVDNNPKSQQGKLTEAFCKGTGFVNYYPLYGTRGTAQPRNMVFELATNPYVVCCDPHVMFFPGAFEALSNYYHRIGWDENNLVQGPIVYDNLQTVSTHFNLDKWGAQMWGQWDTDQYQYDRGEPFEIPAQGLGAFACRKDAWLGFNPRFIGFGGEEGYIHEKFRKHGRKCVCVPKFKWWHRFQRLGTPYPIVIEEKARNYIIGFRELGLPLDPIYDHFVKGKWNLPENQRLSEKQWEMCLREELLPLNPVEQAKVPTPKTSGCGTCSQNSWDLGQWYKWASETKSDINEHVPTLREYASKSERVIEFGVRTGVSTAGLLAGSPKQLISYDLNESSQARTMANLAVKEGKEFQFFLGDSLTVDPEECDLLFIDTKHTGEQCLKELLRHGPKVNKWIILHDTEIYGDKGEDNGPGLRYAIRTFLETHREWTVARHYNNNHGLTVLSKLKEDQPPKLPSVIRMSMNYAKSQGKDLFNGKIRVPLEVAEERYAICTSNGGVCPVKQRRIEDDRCAGCGCWLWEQPGQPEGAMTGKVWRPLDSCPFGKWGNWVPEEGRVQEEVK